MNSDSGRHAQRGDAKQAPSEGCQSGPKGIAQMTSPNLRVEELREDGEKVCSLCNGARTVRDNIDPLDYPEPAPCPKCGDGEWAYRALINRQSPEAVTDESLIEALRQASWDLRYAKREFGRCGDKHSACLMEVAQKAADAALLKVSPR